MDLITQLMPLCLQQLFCIKNYFACTGFIIVLFCISLFAVEQWENSRLQNAQVTENYDHLNLAQIKELSFNQANQVVEGVIQIAKQALSSKNKQVFKKQINHYDSIITRNKLQGMNLMIDSSIISLLQNLPQVQQLIFEIIDKNNDKQISQKELNRTIHGVYRHLQDKKLVDDFSKELFQKINKGQSFNFQQFQQYFISFLASLLTSSTKPFENTPPFEKEDIKGLILYLSSERRIWDNCLYTAFKILNKNNDQYVTVDEISTFLISINKNIWNDAKPYVQQILGYMRITGNSNGEQFNLGQLITFGELVRPYMGQILDKYIN
ncbi:transmembrane protein, putative (macronuclear) [Tetrahymena thermophila SB210]|uniref:Transmembrane protein, putative n=1 Tax=Tetrahymena thermophila (strain SB210) TaxID=312017 RepID=I7LW90_TETTS|nr:transmembrane protein, putative [Tetrahymena thermophila SB210]EAS01179.2 transmembrane protein, putative [Tetrahymena thermophila SB210]|eukprot:XP_001021424.2 transmembrane protein, putative [Tetrahymena thermophila SB210]